MEKSEIAAKACRIIGEHLEKDPAGLQIEQKLIEDLGADSLDGIEIVMALEEEFDCEILGSEWREEIINCTVGDVIDECVRAIAARNCST